MGRRVLLVGATGTFGARLAALLARRPGLDLVLAARGLEALEALRGALLASGAVAQLSVRRFDRLQPEKLGELEPWLVVDAAGPFQGDDYALAFAAVRCGAHYVDLADTRGFVAGFTEALDVEARAAGVLAVTGASSTPALSQAVLEPLVRDWRQLDEVVVAISPGARAPRGLSVMQAILSYAGQPVRVFRQGNWRTVRGWSGLRPLDMPGLGRRLASICETPDLDLLPRRFPIRGDALFMAGLELTPMHLGLTLLSLPVRWGLLKSLRPLARPLRRVADLLAPFGSDKGGMIVEATGLDEKGRRIRARWALCAEANAGPSTPAAPAAALVNALLDEAEWEPGARACVGLLSPVQILGELDHLPIHTRVQESHVGDPVLFRRLLGRWMDAAPLSIRTVHGAGAAAFRGRATARAGRSLV
ncbi:MAG: saccharopine dehydrogenase NADP-binding domain-containing protein, partial [Caulobacteraceae bacterium]